jgi:hypothetical protein
MEKVAQSGDERQVRFPFRTLVPLGRCGAITSNTLCPRSTHWDAQYRQ